MKKKSGPRFRGHGGVKFDLRTVKLPRPPRVRSHPALEAPPPKDSGNLGHCIDCVRGPEALKYLARDPNVRGVGVAQSREDGAAEYSVGFLVYKKLPRSRVPRGCLLPDRVDSDGGPIEVRVLELDGDIQPAQMPCPLSTFEPSACAGARVGNEPPTATSGFGTFGGSWDALIASGRRGLVNAHTAIGLDLQGFLAGLPASLGSLFQSPRGEEIFTGAFGFPDNFRIMEIDTVHPMLTPFSTFAATIPLVLPAGVLAFVLLDCAAGDVDYQSIPAPPLFLPPGPPPARARRGGIVGGGRIRRANLFPRAGDAVWSPGGQAVSFGNVLLSNLQLAIGFAPLVIIVDQILAVQDLFFGDSGSPMLSTGNNAYYGSRWAGIGPPATTPGGLLFSRTSLATPARLIMTSMDLELV